MIRKKRIIRETRLPDDAESIMKVFSAAKGIIYLANGDERLAYDMIKAG